MGALTNNYTPNHAALIRVSTIHLQDVILNLNKNLATLNLETGLHTGTLNNPEIGNGLVQLIRMENPFGITELRKLCI